MYTRKALFTKLIPLPLVLHAVVLAGAIPATAQLNVDVPVVLGGSEPQERQVTGLSTPIDGGDAVSLGAARTGSTSTVSLSGSLQLSGDLTPAPVSYTVGMIVTVIPAVANLDEATLDLNGLGPVPIVRTGGMAITSGDLQPGVPARLVYDGSRFQFLSATALPCKVGQTAASQRYCIADQPLPSATFFDAITTCADQGARLCTISEWSHACRSIPGFFATVTEAEWVDHAANNNTGAKLVGFGIDGGEGGLGSGCEFGGQVVPTTPYRYRCCSNR